MEGGDAEVGAHRGETTGNGKMPATRREREKMDSGTGSVTVSVILLSLTKQIKDL